MVPGRRPCINPACRRTGPVEKFPGEMICGKCFRCLPAEDRAYHRRCWREIRKWDRRIARTEDDLDRQRMKTIREKWIWRLNLHWNDVVKPRFHATAPPAGLEAFMEQTGIK